MKDVPVFVPEAPLSTAALLETANPNEKKPGNVKLKDLKDMVCDSDIDLHPHYRKGNG